MILASPVRGTIRPDARYYPTKPNAILRPAGDHSPLLTQDFGPSSVVEEPTIVWPGGDGIPAGSYANFHVGIDISNAGCGYDVLATAAGKVTTSSRNASGAEVIVIDHGQGFTTRYVHMSTRLVAVGAIVPVGKVIGKIGSTGILSTGCHLHFAVTKADHPVDPWRRLAQNTSVDPDAPEDTMPPLTSYIPGQVAKIANAVGDVNVRATPTLAGTIVRQVPMGQSESWTVIGWVKGDLAAGSDQWLYRWNGAWEYVHKVNVVSVAAIVVDCTAAVAAAKAAGYADAKAKAGAAVAGI